MSPRSSLFDMICTGSPLGTSTQTWSSSPPLLAIICFFVCTPVQMSLVCESIEEKQHGCIWWILELCEIDLPETILWGTWLSRDFNLGHSATQNTTVPAVINFLPMLGMGRRWILVHAVPLGYWDNCRNAELDWSDLECTYLCSWATKYLSLNKN